MIILQLLYLKDLNLALGDSKPYDSAQPQWKKSKNGTKKDIGNFYHHRHLLLLQTREKIIAGLKINFQLPAKTYIDL